MSSSSSKKFIETVNGGLIDVKNITGWMCTITRISNYHYDVGPLADTIEYRPTAILINGKIEEIGYPKFSKDDCNKVIKNLINLSGISYQAEDLTRPNKLSRPSLDIDDDEKN